MSKRTRPRNLQALERRRKRHARRSAIGYQRAFARLVFGDVFARTADPARLAAAIRRRLAVPSALFEPDYGMPLRDLLTSGPFPTDWQRMPDIDGAKIEWRLTSATVCEFRVLPRAYAPNIDVTIGFAPIGEPVPPRAIAVMDQATCEFCRSMDGTEIAATAVPWGACTGENGCRCVAADPRSPRTNR